ncbi:Wzz/FepE/Etk N-terminal domain-containing protein [Shewanella corallii]|uniref:Wzz/FepE/Etk N-terminal domain-containing protein n=2 Tax=Shewanella corallii TaxID=560080 RepID=A0ABT0N5R9_9GAMM|nr:Wzz/FepE/Etk N-terminal domain-containing protein [Shewanella corallii]MCL2913162.1 Wzz/FepE/Etk N-terminal domain-containing protein [Shewanella corallii]
MTNQIQNHQNCNDAQFTQSMRDDEIDLRELFSAIWQGKWLIIAVTAVFAVGSVIFALSQPNIYKSEALLAPAESDNSGGGLAALAGQFGGLASMAGINIGSGSVDKSQLAIEVMKSRQFISDFIQKHKILPELMAAEKWDMPNNELVYDPELYDSESANWVRDVKAPFKSEPSMQEAFKAFSKMFSVNAAKDTGMITVSVEHLSPVVAQQWVNWLVADINQVMKQRDVEEAVRGRDFLEDQLRKTSIADMRTVLYQLMEEAQKTIMFANIREEYVFKTIDPALVPEERSKPKRAQICILGTMLGGILSLMIVFAKYFIDVRVK